MFFARLYGLKDRDARRRIAELFEKLNLTELAKRRFSEISTGNKQKLAVARALLPAPPVLLLDEPTRSLDPLAATELRNLISSLENVSILLTSHNLSEIEELCQRVAVISKGEIRAVDTPENLRRTNKTVQTVNIFFSGIDENKIREILSGLLNDYSVKEEKDFIKLVFERESGDDLLGKTVSKLNESGATIFDVATESATLLDVLESYE